MNGTSNGSEKIGRCLSDSAEGTNPVDSQQMINGKPCTHLAISCVFYANTECWHKFEAYKLLCL